MRVDLDVKIRGRGALAYVAPLPHRSFGALRSFGFAQDRLSLGQGEVIESGHGQSGELRVTQLSR